MKYLVVLLVVFVGVWVWRNNRIATNKDKQENFEREAERQTLKKPWWRVPIAAFICRKSRRWPRQVRICAHKYGFAARNIDSLAQKAAEYLLINTAQCITQNKRRIFP
jgi:hypothetical protein